MTMQRAVELADQAEAIGQNRVGCTIDKDGVEVAGSFNRAKLDCDPTAHAEILALRQAATRLGTRVLSGSTAYVTLEPCPMCMYALMIAKVDKVVYLDPDLNGSVSKGYHLQTPWRDGSTLVVETGSMP